MGLKRIFEHLSTVAYRSASSIVHAMDKKIISSRWRIISESNSIANSLRQIVFWSQTKIFRLAKKITDRIDDIEKSDEQSVKNTITKLESASPLKTLSRGYAKIFGNNKDIKSVHELSKNDKIDIYFSDGKAEAQIKNIEGHNHEPRRKP